jgi:hypothetical protein
MMTRMQGRLERGSVQFEIHRLNLHCGTQRASDEFGDRLFPGLRRRSEFLAVVICETNTEDAILCVSLWELWSSDFSWL